MSEDMDNTVERREFARLLMEASAQQAVAEAEEIVCAVWTHHLNRLVDTAHQTVKVARRLRIEAEQVMRAMQQSGDPDALHGAQVALETAQENERRAIVQAREVLAEINDEIIVVDAADRTRAANVEESARRVAAHQASRTHHGPRAA